MFIQVLGFHFWVNVRLLNIEFYFFRACFNQLVFNTDFFIGISVSTSKVYSHILCFNKFCPLVCVMNFISAVFGLLNSLNFNGCIPEPYESNRINLFKIRIILEKLWLHNVVQNSQNFQNYAFFKLCFFLFISSFTCQICECIYLFPCSI
jgi:hypothetical protein